LVRNFTPAPPRVVAELYPFGRVERRPVNQKVPSQPSSSRSHRVLLYVLMAGTTAIAGYWLARTGAPHVYVESVSPDGRFRAVIIEESPRFLMASPYVYRFSIFSAGSDAPLSGSEHVRNTDSVSLGSCQFEWSVSSVTISTPQSTPKSITGHFADHQQWSQ
jgi:hypothetical protein